MRLFGFTIERSNHGQAQKEGWSQAEVRIASLEGEVRAWQETARRLEAVAARLDAAELGREAAFSKGIEALRSVLGRISVGRRKSRPTDDAGDGDGDTGDDWLRGYNALRGHALGAAPPRFEVEDVTEEGE